MDVGTIKAYVRNHLEVDEEELPDVLLNPYLQDAFDRTMAYDNRWPRYEATWDLSQVPGSTNITLPGDRNRPSIMSVISTGDGYRLVMISPENAEQTYLNGNITVVTGAPIYYSLWQDKMQLWPQPEEASLPYDLQVRAYRQPVWDNGSSAVPDLDERLHITLAYYAMALVYAQQEDEILEGVYMARWQRDLSQQMKAILEAPHHRPLVLHGGATVGGVPSYVINPPAT
jgi:hypothetical protein